MLLHELRSSLRNIGYIPSPFYVMTTSNKDSLIDVHDKKITDGPHEWKSRL
jgi:hypothetical protein